MSVSVLSDVPCDQ